MNPYITFLVVLTFSNGILSADNDTTIQTPVLLWHGMGDSCCNPLSMGYIAKLIKSNLPGIYIRSVMLGNNVMEDVERGFLANMNAQIKAVCRTIQEDEELKDGYNAIGFSQGGLFVRALAQRCPSPPMRNLISVGGPQQGVFGLPLCPGSDILCNTARRLLDYGAYAKFVQRTLVQAQYWHDPKTDQGYREKSIFLADLNCEKSCDQTYRENLLKLRNFALVKFQRDQMIIPKASSWFGYYAENDTTEIVKMKETNLYKEDRIGLKALDESGRLQFIPIDGIHLQISPKEFVTKIIQKYLVPDQ